MKRTLAAEVPGRTGDRVLLKGWVHAIRPLGGIGFLVVRDRSGQAQVVLEGQDEFLRALPEASAVVVRGVAAAEPRAPGGAEIRQAEVEVVAKAVPELPFEVNHPGLAAGLDTQLDHRVLSLRHPRQAAVFRVQAELVRGFREALRSRGFLEVHTPKLVATGTEGGAELFAVDYFGRRAYLAQSPQFYKQMLVGAGLERVFEVGPVYRAEDHDTSRHLNEYVSLDLEVGFLDGLADLMDLEEAVLEDMFAAVTSSAGDALRLWGAATPRVRGIPRIRLDEAAAILDRRHGHQIPEGNLDPEGERLLAAEMERDHGCELVFVTHYPASKRPVYAMPDPADPALTLSFDLLFRGLEVTTGGQRIHDGETLRRRLDGRGLDPEAFAPYLEAFQYGMPPHGGLAIGLERLTMKLLGLGNVREASLFPRDRGRLAP
ncbi:MAG: aspartate--tRNA(Asn) ligase [bacterium]|nr:aspartate--tRNA(Asn) ligase [bacterium]